jgi:signal transduction histidine kinase/ligand-binding sensor domain-containing protein
MAAELTPARFAKRIPPKKRTIALFHRSTMRTTTQASRTRQATAAGARSFRLRPAVATATLAAATVLSPAWLGAETIIHFERLQSRDGLPHQTVTSILQDRVGFLWLGTQDGLARYDGHRFVTYGNDPEDPSTLTNSYVRALLEDASGDLWVATHGGGLSRWHRITDSFSHYLADGDDPGSLADDNVLALYQDRDGMLWIGIAESGLDRLDPATGEFEHFRNDPSDPSSLSDDRVLAVVGDRRGGLWIGTQGGLDRFDRESGTFRRFRCVDGGSADENSVRTIFEDQDGHLWIGTLAGDVFRFDRRAQSFEHFELLPSERVRVITANGDGRLWIGSDSGLQLLDRSSGTAERFRHQGGDVSSLSNDRVAAIYQDRGGVLWIGTQGGGLNKWDPRTSGFSHRTVGSDGASGPASQQVFGIADDPEGGLWIGTGNGLYRLDRKTGDSERFVHRPGDGGSLAGDHVTALLRDRTGRLWIGTLGSGLDRLDPGLRTFAHYRHDEKRADSLGSDAVATLFEDRGSSLWIGTFGGGLNRFEGDDRFTRFRNAPGDPRSISSDRVTALAEDGEGHLWAGTFGGGLNRFTPRRDGGTFLRFQRDPDRPTSLASDHILALYFDSREVLWVGTQSGGLHELKSLDETTGEAVFRRYLKGDGLPNNTVYGIQPAGAKLWLSTNRGLSCFDPAAGTFENFTVSHGLQSNEFNMGAHYKSAGGELFFGGVNGFNSFHSDRLDRPAPSPPIVLTAFSKMNEPVTGLERPIYDLDEVRLEHDESIFSFEFAALDFSAPAENRYRSKLEGWDQDWIDQGNHPRVNFSNLEPGSYVLRVKAANNDGVWNEEGLSIRVHVIPPWWRTWWFQLLALAALSSLVVLAIKARMTQITKERLQVLVEKRTRELEEAQEQLFRRKKLAVLGELAGSVAHELRNPLGAIRNILYLLKLKPPDAAGLNAYCTRIDHEIGRSDRIITELLDWGRDTPADLRRAVLQEIVREALEGVEIPESVHLERRLATQPIAVEVDAGQVQRILQNFLQNAIEAMPDGGDLVVECSLRVGNACVSVRDSGVGIPPDKIERIFEPLVSGKPKGVGLGLPLSQRYAERNHGRIECESTVGEGSTFRLLLPPAKDARG